MARRSGTAVVLIEAGLPGVGRWMRRVRQRVGEILWGGYIRRTADALVVLDPVAREQALRQGFDERLLRVVPHGVDVLQFRPGLISPLVGSYRVRGRILLHVGRLDAAHGVHVALAAFARTVGQRGDWSLVIAGDGPAKPELRAMADRLGVAARVHWLPRPRTEELPGLMGASTALVAPAIEDVVSGRHVGRALACGLPVLASALPRLRGLLEGDDHGLLVQTGSVEAWVEAIRRLAGSPALRQRWSHNARAFAETELGWPAITSRFEEILLSAQEHAAQRRQPVRKSARAV
jgi:glycosyltransferase involved in cell wall biosynthesis